ncbi:MAG: hypothetical protein ACK446_15895, partial [Rhodobacterales bacterium]
YSFHGRGTLNGVIPHPSLVRLFEDTARDAQMALQRSAQVGVGSHEIAPARRPDRPDADPGPVGP